ncbi:hypothetical protein [Cylindrospermopsis raciborskii]|uniref:hypothetical protein n=1 Tax=Cylindrospermopsis raciborskii TaxID=77022 RepID=UPI0038D0F9E3
MDYLIQNSQVFLVVEAKNEDLEKGFLQLAMELIALDKWMERVFQQLLSQVGQFSGKIL